MKGNGPENFSLIPNSDVREQKFQYNIDHLKTLHGYEINKFTACYTRPFLQNAKTVALCVPFQLKSHIDQLARRNQPKSRPGPKRSTLKEIKLLPSHVPTESDTITQNEEYLTATQQTDPDQFVGRNTLRSLTLRDVKGVSCPPVYWSNQKENRLKTEESNTTEPQLRGSLRKNTSIALSIRQTSEPTSEGSENNLDQLATINRTSSSFRKVSFVEPVVSARKRFISHDITGEKPVSPVLNVRKRFVSQDVIEEKQEEQPETAELNTERKTSVVVTRQKSRSVTAHPVKKHHSVLLRGFESRNNSISPNDQLQLDKVHSATARPERNRFFSEDGAEKSEPVSARESKLFTPYHTVTENDAEGGSNDREKFIRDFINENFGGSATQGQYIRTMSNQQSMMRYTRAHSTSPHQILKNFEKLVTEESPPPSQRSNFSYMDVALNNDANEEVDKSKTTSRKQRAKDRAAKRKEWREKFGVIGSLEADFAEFKKNLKEGDLGANLRTPKFKLGKESPTRLIERPVKNRTRGQIAWEVQRKIQRTHNKIVEESSARLLRGHKLTPNRLEIIPPMRTANE